MSSWEEIANEVAPLGYKPSGLATGAHRRALLDEATERSRCAPIFAPATSPAPRVVSSPPFAFDVSLDDALRGVECENGHGKYYRIVRAAPEYCQTFEALAEKLCEAAGFIACHTRTPCDVRDLLFMDIETTGLSAGSPLFLIGTLRMEWPCSVLEFFLARSLYEERAVLAAFHAVCEGKTLVTFNGKRFDWPYIEGRSLRTRLPVTLPRAHFDLLHYARRRWRPLVPNCRLQTLELYLCHRQREGDVPSSLIPRHFREFAMRYAANGSGVHLLAPIIHHNAWDVLTMADLLQRIDDKPMPGAERKFNSTAQQIPAKPFE